MAAQLGDKLVYLRQANLGGSGGFTRGLYEISSISDHANVILMDDDILCEPETVLRLNAFANLTPTPTIVGAQMLNLKNTRYLHVGAEEVNLTTLQPGRWAPNALHSSDMVKHQQKKRTDAEYNGWWSCLIPAEVIAAVGLPLPIFIKWDDIEYGLRAGAAGFPTVTLPNAGVWHADFHWKDLDDWTHYFIVRNSLITAALHGDIDVSPTGTMLARVIAEAIISMRYGLAHTMIRGLEDFLEGPADLADGGMAAGSSIRTERNEYSETIMHPAVKTGELTNALPRTRPAGFLPNKDRILPGARQTGGVPVARTHGARTGDDPGRRLSLVACLAIRLRSGHRCVASGRQGPAARQAEHQEAVRASGQGHPALPRGSACAATAVPRRVARTDQP